DEFARYELATRLVLGHVREGEHLGGDVGGVQRLDDDGGAATGERGGLEDDAGACREGREHSSRGDREGEVPRGRDDREASGKEARAVETVELPSSLGVVVREVD